MSVEKNWRRFQKEWKQGKYTGVTRTASLCVATACVTLLGVYFFQGKQAEDSVEALRAIRQSEQASEETEPMYLQEDLSSGERSVQSGMQELAMQNPDLIGWLTIEGTSVDYPVMWTPEKPDYYSHRGFDRTESKNGLLFLDGNSNVNEYGGNLIIYGHNMKNGSMFAELLNYESEVYWEEHPTVLLDTLYESRVYEIVAVLKSADMSLLPFGFTGASREDAETALSNMRENALYDTGISADFGDDFLSLATCDYSAKDGRLVVMARRIQ